MFRKLIPNSQAGLSVAATPRRRKVQATPSSPVAAAIIPLPGKNATVASPSLCGDEASPLLSAGRFRVRVNSWRPRGKSRPSRQRNGFSCHSNVAIGLHLCLRPLKTTTCQSFLPVRIMFIKKEKIVDTFL
jgi:hypothetical protein